MRRVVVTGLGIVSCLGNNQEEVHQSLLNSKSGISYSEEYKEHNLRMGDKMTASAYASSPRSSALHISVKRGVAVYLSPDNKYSIYKVVKTTSPFSDSID